MWAAPLPPAIAADIIERRTTEVPFVTLRNLRPDRDPPDRFGGQRSDRRFGVCVTEDTNLFWLREANSALPVSIPEGYTQVTGVQALEPDPFWQRVAKRANGERPVLYIHGYNESFARSCRRLSQLQYAINCHERMILFSWPSDGNPTRYTRDEADIGWSEDGLAKTLLDMQHRFGEGGFDVIAHSLGSRAVMRVSAELGADDTRNKPAIGQLLFIASDVDTDVFRRALPAMTRAAERVSVIVNDQDLPLKLSQELHGAARLGQAGDALLPMPGANVFDLSALPMRGASGHLYHLNHPAVHRLIKALLTGTRASRAAEAPITLLAQ